MLWAAEGVDTGGEGSFAPVDVLLRYGILGVIVLLAMFGWVHFRPEVNRLEKQIADMKTDFDKQVLELRKDYTDQIANLRKDHTEQISLMRAERDKALEQRNAMAETFQKEWIPALTKSLSTVDALRALMERIIDRGRGEQ